MTYDKRHIMLTKVLIERKLLYIKKIIKFYFIFHHSPDVIYRQEHHSISEVPKEPLAFLSAKCFHVCITDKLTVH